MLQFPIAADTNLSFANECVFWSGSTNGERAVPVVGIFGFSVVFTGRNKRRKNHWIGAIRKRS